jgi:GcrA cell cycle regulator
MSWTDERVETLKRLWTEGLSASQIASSLGEVTRNAVIGKIHRLGLSGRARPGVAAAPARKPKPAQTVRRHARPAVAAVGNTALKVEPSYVAELEPEPSAVVLPMGERVTIMMLTEQTCRWPIGDPGSEGFSFCGRRSEAGIPYCANHARIAYQPVDRRRDRRGGH